jgi:beta-N-acetylhexosaminidase
MTDVEGLAARLVCVGFPGTTVTPELRELVARGVSSVILFSRNYESVRQLCELCAAIKSLTPRPIMVCVDQEGGRVQRFGAPFTIIPTMREIGRHNDVSLARNVGRVIGSELRAVNIDMNLAPVLDVDSNPANPVIGARSFSDDPHVVARLGCALAEGLQSTGVAACGKHFPGHGDTSVDSHFDLPRLPHDMVRLEQIELPPFVAAIHSGMAAIMTTHVMFDAVDGEHPATMSHAVVQRLLRDRLGFDRVVISDDLEMKAIVDHFGINRAVIDGVKAGVDLFLICHSADKQHGAIDALIEAARNGAVAADRLVQCNSRLDSLFRAYVQPPHAWSELLSERIGCDEHRALVCKGTAQIQA